MRFVMQAALTGDRVSVRPTQDRRRLSEPTRFRATQGRARAGTQKGAPRERSS
jgi:hypothetical protein